MVWSMIYLHSPMFRESDAVHSLVPTLCGGALACGAHNSSYQVVDSWYAIPTMNLVGGCTLEV